MNSSVAGRFPLKMTLWEGAILCGIASATMSARNISFSGFRYWKRNHYVLNGEDGTEGVVTFAGGHWFPDAPLVGVFHDVHSSRYRPNRELELDDVFSECPNYQRSLADQFALRQLRLDVNGKSLHRVTSVFWDEGEFLHAGEPWEEVFANGASLLDDELTEDRETVFADFSVSMSPEVVAFIRSIYQRKIGRPATTIELSERETGWLKSIFENPIEKYRELDKIATECELPSSAASEAKLDPWYESINVQLEAERAITACREMFAEIGIILPEV